MSDFVLSSPPSSSSKSFRNSFFRAPSKYFSLKSTNFNRSRTAWSITRDVSLMGVVELAGTMAVSGGSTCFLQSIKSKQHALHIPSGSHLDLSKNEWSDNKSSALEISNLTPTWPNLCSIPLSLRWTELLFSIEGGRRTQILKGKLLSLQPNLRQPSSWIGTPPIALNFLLRNVIKKAHRPLLLNETVKLRESRALPLSRLRGISPKGFCASLPSWP
mmetsp:Transcript_5701/g.9503  ORF Transcript_5701/g.9503 Transcript_5701/m.9503 type:complete len:217 (-) Transcript_5701:332-982(-)